MLTTSSLCLLPHCHVPTYLPVGTSRSTSRTYRKLLYLLYLTFRYIALDITHHRERYRCLRENVMLVVREYNSILKALLPQAITE